MTMLIAPSNMIIDEIKVKIKDLIEGYIDESEQNPDDAIMAYNNCLCVRPAFQRSFVYESPQETAVIDTVIKGFPLGLIYWADNGDGTYDCLDGQQRILSICRFAHGYFTPKFKWHSSSGINMKNLTRKNPELAERFLNYELTVKICRGPKAERMEWFRTINIVGKSLTDQELRNANHVGPWLEDAKRYFSKNTPGGSAPAERVGGDYTKANANRQELLEQVISWHANSEKKDDTVICEYMEKHIDDKNANELWNYYNNVIDWVKNLFVETHSGMKTVPWGILYNKYKNEEFDVDELNELYTELMDLRTVKEITSSVAKICEYCITREEQLLKIRAFDEGQRRLMHKRQKGICPDCGEFFTLKEMQAHHIKSWHNGGATELDNGVMLCKECHKQRHL